MNGAFSRSIAFRSQVMAILAMSMSSFATQQMIAGLGEYESRGHGGRYKPNRSRPAFGRSGWPSGKYKPDDGICKSEARETGAPRVSTPRPKWHVVTSISPLPPVANSSASDFMTHADRFLDALPKFVAQANASKLRFKKRADAIRWAKRNALPPNSFSIQLH